ncbi:aminopeptidase P N-terminal domain-containing protein [Pseudomarimonas arenosa]|uniref:Xaa-Pro aminopeptidase n=1 Tax=Pseudomarimonas arenosa TaxID=2774145 RepID=A0AAW3ZPS1_9GAMM|nr:aminopeptidase P N-terminal domain-containing protein [Pseudomarimonas arenosa]MBD8527494.1 aminopeptidase P N-terminal domain-containing protein [Pseudomarimonas arenosa]
MIKNTEYAKRRRLLMRQAGEDSILILPAAPERVRSRDTHYPYRQDSDLLYLSGFAEPESVLVLVPGRKHGEVLLFCRERNAERETWDGPRLGPARAPGVLGLDDAYDIADIDDILPGLLEGRSKVYYHFGRDADFDLKLIGWVNRVRALIRQGARPPHEFLELGHLLNEQRLFKSRDELKAMQRAADIAVEGHCQVMRACRPGLFEYSIDAELSYVFRRHDAQHAYEPIVAAGNNACVLHYRDNKAALHDGDLLLIDAGAEWQGYASDITRTIPINGRFSAAQRAIYELVLEAQAAAIAAVRPGAHWDAPHMAAVEVLAEGMLSLGLLKGTLKQVLKKEQYKPFYMHRTGHWIGLDVHDVGDYRIDQQPRILEPGMVLTVEPGLYLDANNKQAPSKYRGIGVRIEDDVVVTEGGCRVLTEAAPKAIDAVEDWMQRSRAA